MLAFVAIDTLAQVFEAGMLICFGVAWPVDIYKTVRTRVTAGKSVRFMTLVLLGYLSGIVAKFLRADGGVLESVTWLYVLNAILVAVDIYLCLYFRRREPK